MQRLVRLGQQIHVAVAVPVPELGRWHALGHGQEVARGRIATAQVQRDLDPPSLLAAAHAALTDGLVFADIAPLPAAAVGFLGIVSTALATVVYFKLVAAAGPSFLSLINYLIPLWAVMIGMVFLGESPEWSSLAALALILSGIGLSEAGSRRRAPPRG